MTLITILRNVTIAVLIVGLWAWSSAEDWEQELIADQMEAERIAGIKSYRSSEKYASNSSEDEVDTTIPENQEPAPVYIAPANRAKTAVVKTKKRIKRTYNKTPL